MFQISLHAGLRLASLIIVRCAVNIQPGPENRDEPGILSNLPFDLPGMWEEADLIGGETDTKPEYRADLLA